MLLVLAVCIGDSLAAPAQQRKLMVVHRNSNILEYFDAGVRIDRFPCVVGNDDATPVGTFSVLEKVKDKRSMKYDAPMPFSLKFSSDWKAIHGTSAALARSVAQHAGLPLVGSHGCVGLSNANAEKLYNWAQVGTPIQIRGD